MALRFRYDPQKARANLSKHGVSFAEAQTVFEDPLAYTVWDEAHSDDEQREITIGYSQKLRLLLVVHTEVNHGEIRIISARNADAYETQQYLSA